MRDFGFWVRIIAISQLFGLVLANYGDGWLAHDNPVINLAERSVKSPTPIEQPAADVPAKAKRADSNADSGTWQDLYAEGWGGIEAPEMEPVAPDQPEYVRNGSLAPDTSNWAED